LELLISKDRPALNVRFTTPFSKPPTEEIVYNLDVDDLFHESLRLRAETDQSRIDLIRADLRLCLTFADLADTAIDMNHQDHAVRTISKAEKGYSDMLHFFSQANGMTAEVEKELQSKFKQLRERLDELRQQLR